MEELLFLQRITRHKEEIDHVTFQHQVRNEWNYFVCLSVCARERDSVYAFVIVSVVVNLWVGVNVFFAICMRVGVKVVRLPSRLTDKEMNSRLYLLISTDQ